MAIVTVLVAGCTGGHVGDVRIEPLDGAWGPVAAPVWEEGTEFVFRLEMDSAVPWFVSPFQYEGQREVAAHVRVARADPLPGAHGYHILLVDLVEDDQAPWEDPLRADVVPVRAADLASTGAFHPLRWECRGPSLCTETMGQITWWGPNVPFPLEPGRSEPYAPFGGSVAVVDRAVVSLPSGDWDTVHVRHTMSFSILGTPAQGTFHRYYSPDLGMTVHETLVTRIKVEGQWRPYGSYESTLVDVRQGPVLTPEELGGFLMLPGAAVGIHPAERTIDAGAQTTQGFTVGIVPARAGDVVSWRVVGPGGVAEHEGASFIHAFDAPGTHWVLAEGRDRNGVSIGEAVAHVFSAYDDAGFEECAAVAPCLTLDIPTGPGTREIDVAVAVSAFAGGSLPMHGTLQIVAPGGDVVAESSGVHGVLDAGWSVSVGASDHPGLHENGWVARFTHAGAGLWVSWHAEATYGPDGAGFTIFPSTS